MPDLTPAAELRAAAKRLREDASWPSEDLSLAVADWLDAEAMSAELLAAGVEVPRLPVVSALKVARIILGTKENGDA